METFFKIFGIFLIIWVIWYLTGGPQRSQNIKPYVRFDFESGTVNKSGTELKDGLVGEVADPVKSATEIKNSLESIGR